MSCELEINPGGSMYCTFAGEVNKKVIFLTYDLSAVGYEIYKTALVVPFGEVQTTIQMNRYPYVALEAYNDIVNSILIANDYDRVSQNMVNCVLYKLKSHQDAQYHTFDHLGQERSVRDWSTF